MLAIFFWYMFEPATLCPIWLHLPYVVLFLVCFCSILTEFVCLVYISIHIELLHWGHVSTRTCIMSFYRWLSSLLRLQVVCYKIITNCTYFVHAWLVKCQPAYCIYIYLPQLHIDFFNISSICTTTAVSFAVYSCSASIAKFEQVIIFQLIVSCTAGLDKLRTCVRYVFEIINFTNYRNWLFSNKHVREKNLSLSWIRKEILRKWMYIYLTTIWTSDF